MYSDACEALQSEFQCQGLHWTVGQAYPDPQVEPRPLQEDVHATVARFCTRRALCPGVRSSGKCTPGGCSGEDPRGRLPRLRRQGHGHRGLLCKGTIEVVLVAPQATMQSVSEDARNSGLEGKLSDTMEGGAVHLFFTGPAAGGCAVARQCTDGALSWQARTRWVGRGSAREELSA